MAKKKNKAASTKEPKKLGRLRVNYEFPEARELIRNEGITSVHQYYKWWALNTPANIPKRPDRAYKKDWVSWNDFLDSTNEFPFVKRKFRPYNDARTFVHQLALDTKSEWISYAKGGRKPEDIPSRPDLIYKEWFTWKEFLGSDIASVKRNLEASKAIFFIIQNSGRPNNVFQFGITMEGKATILQHQEAQRFKIIGLYHCDIGLGWVSFAEEFGRPYWESGRSDEYMVPNINDFIFQLSDFVERVP